MSSSAKFYTTTISTVICLDLMAIGICNMFMSRASDGILGVGLVFGGACLGIISAVLAQYYGVRRRERKTAQQVATETLSELAKGTKPPDMTISTLD
jgi:hypothetical protein